MWGRLFNRAGRAFLSVIAAGVAETVTGTPLALIIAPVLSVAGKWMRERGFQNVPF